MRILGPDGKPIETGPSVSEEVKQLVQQAKAIVAQGEPHNALQQMVFAFQSDVSSDLVLDTTCEILLDMMQRANASESFELQLFENLKIHRSDPAAYQQVGHWFAQNQQFFVARPFFLKAKELLGDTLSELSQAVDMGFAQVMMSLGAYEEAVNAFHALNDKYGSLPPWLLMELSECYALLRQTDAAEAVYQIAPAEAFEQFPNFPALPMIRDEVGDLLARVRDFDPEDESADPANMDLCDWHYVQTRGILLELNPNPDPGAEAPAEPPEEGGNQGSGRFIYFSPSEQDVAYLVGVAAAMLDAKELAPKRIVWLGDESEPLAKVFGQWWEVEEIRPYRHGDNTDNAEDLTLLVLAHSYNVLTGLPVGGAETDTPEALQQMAEEQFVSLMEAKAGLVAFALDLRWTERQPMTPDIAGFMTQSCSLPWETRFQLNEEDQSVTQIEETRTPDEIAEAIAKLFLPNEKLDETAEDMIEDYEICTDLIIDHRDGTLTRRPLVTHSPIKSPRLGF